MGLLLGKRVRPVIWLCVAMSIAGLYLLCMAGGLGQVRRSDLLVLLCAVCFAGHIQIIDYFSPRWTACAWPASIFRLRAAGRGAHAADGDAPVGGCVCRAERRALRRRAVLRRGLYPADYRTEIHPSHPGVPAHEPGERLCRPLRGADFTPDPHRTGDSGCCIMFAAIIIAQLPEKERKKQ